MILLKNPESLNQFHQWVKLGFPENGSFSPNQLDQLKTCLEAQEEASVVQHAALSKRKQKKHKQFKADWKAYGMWKEQVEDRERNRLRAQAQKEDKKQPEHTNTLQYILL